MPRASAVSPAEQLTCQFSRWPRRRNSSHRNRRHEIPFQRQPLGTQVWDPRFLWRCAQSLRGESRLATVGVDNRSRTRTHLSELLASSKGPTSESMKRWQLHPGVPQHLTRRTHSSDSGFLRAVLLQTRQEIRSEMDTSKWRVQWVCTRGETRSVESFVNFASK